MAIYHLSAKIISRGQGQSAVAAAAYRSGERLRDDRDGELKFYPARANRIRFTDILAPKNAPEWVRDRNRLWNQAEGAEKRKDAQLAREIEVSLPHELTPLQREWLVKDFAREAFVRKGYVVDLAIHAPDKGDPRNHHAHLMITRRTIGPDGFARTKDWKFDPKQLEGWRIQWADLANRHLERHGHEARIDHRSLEAQGVEREATVHVGYAGTEMAARNAQSDRMDALTEILARNELVFELQALGQDLAQLERLAETERRQQPKDAGAGRAEMELGPPTQEQLQKQAGREAEYLRHLEWQQERSREAQRLLELDSRARAFQVEKEREAEEARKKKDEHEAGEAKRAREGDISSASARYAIALGDNYTIRDPYGSLARAAMSESAMFHKKQEEMRAAMARESDPAKRQIIELRRQIEGCEYMAITSDRLAGISQTVTGRKDNAQSVIDRNAAETYRAMAAGLRQERNAMIEAVQARDKAAAPVQTQAPAPQPVREAVARPFPSTPQPARQAESRPVQTPFAVKVREAAAPQPAAAPKIEPARAAPAPVPTPPVRVPSEPVRQPAAIPTPTSKVAAPREAALAPKPASEKRSEQVVVAPTPVPTHVADQWPLAKVRNTEVQKGARAVEGGQTATTQEPLAPSHKAERPPLAAIRNDQARNNEVRVDQGDQNKPIPLSEFMRAQGPNAVPPLRRPIDMKLIANNPEMRKIQQQTRFEEIRRTQEAEKAVERISRDMGQGKPVQAKDLKSLSREQWDRVGQKGTDGLREVVKEAKDRSQAQGGQGRGEGRTRDP